MGALLGTLDALGLADNTVVVFTADHGDMMGERGMWYKFNPYEWSARVPLVVRAPGNSTGRVESGNVSLVDLLPTFLDLATDGAPPGLADAIDGHSLAPMLHGPDESWPYEALIEFTAEGTYAPCLILRKGRYKYVSCESDPGMLFDLESDPGETRNLCREPEHADVAAEMLGEILSRWDPPALKERILESQRRRRFIQQVLLERERPPWDYRPVSDPSRQCVRSSINTSTTLTKGLARYPYMQPVEPDFPRDA